MESAELDFYAPGKDQKKQNQDRLQHQRDDMYAWRGKEQEEATPGIADGPKQRVVEGSQRAAAKEAEQRRKEGAVWDSAAVHHPDRRREWRNTGLTFDRDHFRTSENPDSKYHTTKKGTIGGGGGGPGETYKPYFHDTVTIHKPSTGTKGDNTLLMVSYSDKDAKDREMQASRTRSVNGAAGTTNNNNLCDVLGPQVASKQRAAEMAEAVYSDMVMQQSVKTGTAYGSAESRQLQAPTSEVAYCVREGYEGRHRGGQQQSTKGATVPERRTPATATSPDVVSRTQLEREEELPPAEEVPQPADPFHLNSAAAPDSSGSVMPRQPAEVKSVRVYTVAGHTGTSNSDTSMVRRKSPPRQGEPVVVPDSWLKANNSNKH